MARSIIAIVVAVSLGIIFIAIGELAIQMIYPTGNFPADPKEITRFMESVLRINNILLVFNWAFAAFVASVLATGIQGRTDFKVVAITVGVLQLLTYINLLVLSVHLQWIWLSVTFMYIVIGYLTYLVLRKKHVQTNKY